MYVNQRKFVFVPYWVQDAVNRNRMGLAACFDFEKLSAVLSINDLAGFVALQGQARQIVGGEINTPMPRWDLIDSWQRTAQSDEKRALVLNTIEPLANDPSIIEELNGRLFDSHATLSRFEEPFITYDVSTDFDVMVIYPGFFSKEAVTGDGGALYTRAVEAILKLFYVYRPYHEVAKTPWFKRYLELLSTKRLAV